ncbi:MAG: TlpA family protein disulfide reductase [Dehalococcoidia bacterium]|jgi:peroxiredoxin|nr:TlpA family protein disulfide reductase [Dehalococcoidia bacterium]
MLTAGAQAPEFDLADIEGGRRTLSEALQTGPLILAFFALDCQTCEISYLHWDRIHVHYAEAGGQLWAISLDTPEDARAFVERSGVEFPVLLDEDLELVRRFGPVSTPAMFLVARDGSIAASHEGFERAALNQMSAGLAEHTGLPPVEIAAGEAPELRPGCTIHGL